MKYTSGNYTLIVDGNRATIEGKGSHITGPIERVLGAIKGMKAIDDRGEYGCGYSYDPERYRMTVTFISILEENQLTAIA